MTVESFAVDPEIPEDGGSDQKNMLGRLVKKTAMIVTADRVMVVVNGKVIPSVLGIAPENIAKYALALEQRLNWDRVAEYILDEEFGDAVGRNLLAVPLRRDGEIVGALCAFDKKFNQLFEQNYDPWVLQLMAAQFAEILGLDVPQIPTVHEALTMEAGVQVLLPKGDGREMGGVILGTISNCVQFTSLGDSRFARNGREYQLVSDRPQESHGPYGGSYGFRLVPVS